MSTRDELAQIIQDVFDQGLGEYRFPGGRELRAADALIAEGWRKKPSKAEAMAYVERVLDDENHDDLCACVMWPESCVTYGKRRPWSYSHEGTVEAILALMDRGQ